MSAHNIDLITAPILARIPDVRTVDDGMAIIRDLVIGLARNSADHVFWKTGTELGWTSEATLALAEKAADGHRMAIVETIHHFGGDVEMACDLVEAWSGAYQQRFQQLVAASREGGCA